MIGLNDLGMLANGAARDFSWTEMAFFGAGLVLGGIVTYTIGKFEKETSGEIAAARKEGYKDGREAGEEKGKEAYRKALRTTLKDNSAGISRANPETGHVVEIPLNEILSECDERSGYGGF